MDKTQKEKAEKLQTKLDKLLETREKKQAVFDKTKQELNNLTKEIDSVKLKLFEILQSGSDDSAFSNWVKKKISENGKNENRENGNSANSEKSETPIPQNPKLYNGQNQQTHIGQNQQSHTAQTQYRASKPNEN
jgi:hypothetical protein